LTDCPLISRLTFVIAILTTTTCWSQLNITGTVIFKDDKSAASGIRVVEKGTENGTLTNSEGDFKLTVSDPRAILIFSFIGVRTQEFQLSGQREIFVKLKLDCNKDFFDSRQVHIYANSGLINNPIGGQVDVASPWVFRGVLKGSYSYQTNLNQNDMHTGQLEFGHYISNCDFDMDFRSGFRHVMFDNKLSFRTNSIEADLNLRTITLIAGYSYLDFNKIESAENRKLSGIVIGIGRYFYIPFHPTATLKIGLYKDKLEYQALIQGGHKRLSYFLKFYKLDSFNEISLGIGTGFGYRTKKRKG
jgi:hypothetical protein